MTEKDVKPKEKKMTKKEIEEALINNFISLQRVLTNLSVKFETLSINISKLLQLFEISAKNLAENYSLKNSESPVQIDQEFLKKLDSLLDQNKTISKAILLMEDRIRNRGVIKQPGPDENPVINQNIYQKSRI